MRANASSVSGFQKTCSVLGATSTLSPAAPVFATPFKGVSEASLHHAKLFADLGMLMPPGHSTVRSKVQVQHETLPCPLVRRIRMHGRGLQRGEEDAERINGMAGKQALLKAE
ncbi:hypothetical protein D1Y84_14480 [Acidipila sp. EB88]|nr:hypothetical protein D1Y84_14480 [Acidipila sp. EB88]